MSIRVRNWRDQAPYVGHISALVWTLYQSHDKDETSPPEVNRLHGINSFVKHGLQGHQHSDHHQHDSIEQLYFILRGRGQLTIGDDKVDVRDGTAVYMPVNVPHQAFNDGDGWMEHLIVSCPLDEIREGTPAVRDWRDVHPVVLEGGTVSWPLLLREEEVPASEGGVLQRVHGVTRYAVQGRQGTDWQQLDGIELVHYVLSGYGTIEEADGNRQLVTDGSAAHVLPGVAHRFANQGEGWFEYVTFAVEVGEVEMPQESDEDADSEEADEEYGVEEAVAAAVVAEVDWDDAEPVEAEDEIEDAAVDEIDDGEEEVEAEEYKGEEAADADGSGDDDDAVADELDGEDIEATEAEEADEAEETEEEIDVAEEASAEDGEEGGAGDTEAAADDETEVEKGEDAEAAFEEETSEVDVDYADEVEEEAEEDETASAQTVDDGDEAEDDDDIDLEDDDTDFDIEDEDEPAVEDDTGEEVDDSPDTDRR
ncbi:MAG: cupin domain-containing protein [Gemmatimonadetes bacterium]|nr:cupin domain-containing protein [Gemmatimonadota bacterium]